VNRGQGILKKIFICFTSSLKALFMLTALNSTLWAYVDVRLGATASFSTLDFSRISEANAGMGENPTQLELDHLNRTINSAFAGVQYNLYTQAGWTWDIFQAGGEIAFGFNAFTDTQNSSHWTSVMGLSPRAYFGFDLFLARLTFITGVTFNFQAGNVPLLENYTQPKFDLGFRLGIGPLLAEFIGAINVIDPSLSLFRIGIGVEFIVYGG
jgi:hypothetical protein